MESELMPEVRQLVAVFNTVCSAKHVSLISRRKIDITLKLLGCLSL